MTTGSVTNQSTFNETEAVTPNPEQTTEPVGSFVNDTTEVPPVTTLPSDVDSTTVTGTEPGATTESATDDATTEETGTADSQSFTATGTSIVGTTESATESATTGPVSSPNSTQMPFERTTEEDIATTEPGRATATEPYNFSSTETSFNQQTTGFTEETGTTDSNSQPEPTSVTADENSSTTEDAVVTTAEATAIPDSTQNFQPTQSLVQTTEDQDAFSGTSTSPYEETTAEDTSSDQKTTEFTASTTKPLFRETTTRVDQADTTSSTEVEQETGSTTEDAVPDSTAADVTASYQTQTDTVTTDATDDLTSTEATADITTTFETSTASLVSTSAKATTTTTTPVPTVKVITKVEIAVEFKVELADISQMDESARDDLKNQLAEGLEDGLQAANPFGDGGEVIVTIEFALVQDRRRSANQRYEAVVTVTYVAPEGISEEDIPDAEGAALDSIASDVSSAASTTLQSPAFQDTVDQESVSKISESISVSPPVVEETVVTVPPITTTTARPHSETTNGLLDFTSGLVLPAENTTVA